MADIFQKHLFHPKSGPFCDQGIEGSNNNNADYDDDNNVNDNNGDYDDDDDEDDDIYIMMHVCLFVTKNDHFLLGVSCNHLNHP